MTDIRVIVDDDLKTRSEQILYNLDLTVSQAVRMFLRQVVKDEDLPFNPFEKRFNQETEKAIKRAKNKKNLITHKSLKSAFAEWDKA
ncbi:MAG: hypothetical protein A2887_01025 [Alphaproteobacteria bacterium RIFCSPLOWO2_01_FULL_40_26]|nr:MAG: hypothetical protein A3D15_04260 [Alphaproteobacteria bacterium RIFCSPHIGHO2_02_FULL_40_34]OFW95053.1 MAG: hypothetical protein A2887_01025 [Alphaproteobacteria bacterium RIFCSPLOWO2_01_FULL_40_26]OFX10581.1 MAG: hypothetical protein A3H30_02990 [Alphaproteobacteria bacterium RIFCSPLOWO2_02_FULL_40_19]OFX12133.1 MAG: hypothetical protein A3G22_00500 [Alphaproteobacteria bacterium RIFCSPLOWO2_12_FULL_40_11]